MLRLKERFDIEPMALWRDETSAGIAEILRGGLLEGEGAVDDVLAANLEARLDGIEEDLRFISEESRPKPDSVEALRRAQEFTLAQVRQSPPYRKVPKRLGDPVSVEDLADLRAVSDTIANSSDPLAAFTLYAEADVEIERIEYLTGKLAAAIDQYIQLQVDIARGK